MTPPSLTGKRVMFVRGDSIGDNILAGALLAPIKRSAGAGWVCVVCQDRLADLYRCCPYVDEIRSFDYDRLRDDETFRNAFLRSLADLRADVAVNSAFSRDLLMDLVTAGTGAPERVAFAGDAANMAEEHRRESERIYTHLVLCPDNATSEMDRLRIFAAALGHEGPVVPEIWLSAADRDEARSIVAPFAGRRVVAVAPRTQYEIKDYPHFAEALRSAALGTAGHALVALGSAADRATCDEILRGTSLPSANLCGRTSLRVSFAVLAECAALVASDSALAHAAAALSVPHVVVAGGGHFGRFFPYSKDTTLLSLPLDCFGCNWRCRHAEPHCVRGVPPEIVGKALARTLGEASLLPRIVFAPKPPARCDAALDTRRARNALPPAVELP